MTDDGFLMMNYKVRAMHSSINITLSKYYQYFKDVSGFNYGLTDLC